MTYPWFRAASLDDLMRQIYEDILSSGELTHPSQGDALERQGVLLELENPRARLSRSETRGRLFSCLGELCWYLAGSGEAAFIRYYINDYPGSDASGAIPGAYGPRLFEGPGSQFARVRDLLRAKHDSRRAVLQIFDQADLQTGQEDVPCTCTLQFLARDGALDLIVHMRSNDAFLGLPHDVFSFTMFQEIMATDLSLAVGTYKHFVGSLHLYVRDQERARNYVGEGWQSVHAMPTMPAQPWDAIPRILEAESRIRNGETLQPEVTEILDPYWADIVRLLILFGHTKRGDRPAAAAVARTIGTETYRMFVEARMARPT